MPLFFFDTFNSFVDIDETGHDLPDLAAVCREVRQALPTMLADGIEGRDKAQFRVDVRDHTGKRVVTASALMVIDCLDLPE